MRSIAILSGEIQNLPYIKSIDCVTVNSIKLRVAILNVKEPEFQRTNAFRGKVLVRKKTFSLNFRDLRQILLAAANRRPNGYYVIGSDFCGEIVETGEGVSHLKPGDRVIANNNYPESDSTDAPPGVVTNHASREYEVVPAGKLMRIPDSLDDIQAAGFSIGAQTVYGMLRRLEPERGARVLVTAARSNTALFAIAALHRYGVRLSVTTTSPVVSERLTAMGVERVYTMGREPGALGASEEILRSCREEGGFRYAIDPFLDVHFPYVLPLMATGGKYISCGIFGQAPGAQRGVTLSAENVVTLLVRNIQCMGNCLGSTDDLRLAVGDAATGAFRSPVDSVFTGDSAGPFLDRTFNSPERFGKVLYRYD